MEQIAVLLHGSSKQIFTEDKIPKQRKSKKDSKTLK